MAMKRPAVVAMLALILGEFLAVIGGHIYIFALYVPLIAMQKITVKKAYALLTVIFLSAFLGFCMTKQEMEMSECVYSFQEEDVSVEGNYRSYEETSNGYRFYLEKVEIREKRIFLKKIIVYTEEKPDFKIGNRLRVAGRLCQFEVAPNYGNFDARRYYRSLGIYINVKEKKTEILQEGHSKFRTGMQELREQLGVIFDELCKDANKGIYKICDSKKSGIFKAVILGEKSDLDGEIKEMYQLNGIAHILAISGLHISSIGIAIYKLFRKRFKFVLSGSVSMFVVLGFVFMSGAGISSVRAAWMFFFYLFSQMLGRKYDMLNALGFAVILLCLDNPFVLLNASFQMSFGAMLGILFINPIISDFLGISQKKKVLREEITKKKYVEEKIRIMIRNAILGIFQSMIFSISINLVLLPVMAWNFFEISGYSIILNIIVIPLMAVVLGCALLGAGLAFLAGKAAAMSVSFGTIIIGDVWAVTNISRPVILPACGVLELYEILCRGFSKLPGNIYVTGKPQIVQIILYYGFLILALSGMKCVINRRKQAQKEKEEGISVEGRRIEIPSRNKVIKEVTLKLIKYILAAGFVSGLIFIISPHEHGNLTVMFNDVGQGDGIVIQKKDFVIMVDGGSSDVKNLKEYRLEPLLKARGIKKVNYAIITHADKDHISGITELLKDGATDRIIIENLLLPVAIIKDDGFETLMEAADNGITQVSYIGRGDYIENEGVKVRCLHPFQDFETKERNAYSTVLDVRYKAFTMLLTGDISTEEEGYLLEALGNEKNTYTILKVAHHGSKFSTTEVFLDKIRPKFSVISCGENNSYGHPSEELVKRLENIKSKIWRTDLSGQIAVETDGEEMVVRVMR